MGNPQGEMRLAAAAVNTASSLCLSFCVSKLDGRKYSLLRGDSELSLQGHLDVRCKA